MKRPFDIGHPLDRLMVWIAWYAMVLANVHLWRNASGLWWPEKVVFSISALYAMLRETARTYRVAADRIARSQP